jgi:hypothetical protein
VDDHTIAIHPSLLKFGHRYKTVVVRRAIELVESLVFFLPLMLVVYVFAQKLEME